MNFSTELEINVEKDLFILFYINVEYSIYDDIEIESYELAKNHIYEYEKIHFDFLDNYNLIDWLEENDSKQYERLIERIVDHELDHKNHF